MSFVKGKHYAYSKMVKEDPEERNHRRAQFLIYKVMQGADCQRRQSAITVRICKLKVKVGKRLMRLKKSVLFGVSVARVALHEHVTRRLINIRCLIRSREDMASPSPVFS